MISTIKNKVVELTNKKNNTYLPISSYQYENENVNENVNNNNNTGQYNSINNNNYNCKDYLGGILNWIYGLLLLLAFFSLNYVNYNQYAFAHNIFTSVDTSIVLTQGTYFYMPWVKLEYFPSTYQYVNLSEPVFSDTGLEFDLEIVYYYKLKKDKLASIYNLFSPYRYPILGPMFCIVSLAF